MEGRRLGNNLRSIRRLDSADLLPEEQSVAFRDYASLRACGQMPKVEKIACVFGIS